MGNIIKLVSLSDFQKLLDNERIDVKQWQVLYKQKNDLVRFAVEYEEHTNVEEWDYKS